MKTQNNTSGGMRNNRVKEDCPVSGFSSRDVVVPVIKKENKEEVQLEEDNVNFILDL